MTFLQWLSDNRTKIAGALTTVLGTLMTMITGGAFQDLLDPSAIRWMSITVTLLGALITGIGFNNSTKEKVAEAMETAIMATPPKQRGYIRSSLFVALFTLALTGMMVGVGCTQTQGAYKAAESPDETAYVLTEHYASLVREAANLKAKPSTPPEAVSAMQRADLVAGPVIDSLRPLRDAYVASKSATTEAELQEAVNRAVLAIADLVRQVQIARGAP